jgi:hypothetical protein
MDEPVNERIQKGMPIILFYGEKSRLDKDFAEAFKYGRDHGSCAVIDLSVYQEGGKDYYHFLNDILQKIGDRKAVAAVASEWEKAIDHAEGAKHVFFQGESPSAEADTIKAQTVASQIWAANFAKHGNKPFIEWLSRQSDKYVLIFLKNFEAVPSALQSTVEHYLIPEIEKLSHVKMLIFYEGSSTPSWKTYNFERFIYSVSRINEKLAGFQSPYITGRPVRHSKSGIFVGRQKEFQFIRDNLTDSVIENALVLVAERRMGKTSLLLNIKAQVPETYFPVFLDIQNFDKPRDPKTATAMLLWKMAYEICYQLQDISKTGLHSPKTEAFRDMPKQAFEHDFLRAQIFPVLREKKLLFLFDEFQQLDTWMQEGLLDIDFLEFLRNQMLHSDRLAFVFTGTERLRRLEGAYWSILFNSAKYCEVALLDEQAATELVIKPVTGVIRYTSETVSRLFRFTGCHPYFLQLICSELVNRAKRFSRASLRIEDINAAAENAVTTGEGHLSYLWNKCNEAEQTLLKRIAHSVMLDDPYLIKPSDVAGSQIIDGLLQRDILRRENKGCVFYAGLFYLWIKRNTSAPEIPAPEKEIKMPVDGDSKPSEISVDKPDMKEETESETMPDSDSASSEISVDKSDTKEETESETMSDSDSEYTDLSPPVQPIIKPDLKEETNKYKVTVWLRDSDQKLFINITEPHIVIKPEDGENFSIDPETIQRAEYIGFATSYKHKHSKHRITFFDNPQKIEGKIMTRPIRYEDFLGTGKKLYPEKIKRIERER